MPTSTTPSLQMTPDKTDVCFQMSPSKTPKTKQGIDCATSPFQSQMTQLADMETPKTKQGVDSATSPFLSQKTQLRSINTLSFPLSRAEEAYHTQLTRIKLSESDDKSTVPCKTQGQPIVMKKVSVPRKSSSLAGSPLRKKRTKLM